MTVYLDMVVLLNFLVDGLLLMGTNRLTGYPPGWKRAAAGAAFGGVYAGICMMPDFRFMGNLFWRTLSLAVMACIAFGWNFGTIRRGTVFVLLSMALGGIAMGMNGNNFVTVLMATIGVAFLCFGILSGEVKVVRHGAGALAEVEPSRERAGDVVLRTADRRLHVVALREVRGDGARERAAGTVGVGVVDPIAMKPLRAVRRPEEVVGVVEVVAAF